MEINTPEVYDPSHLSKEELDCVKRMAEAKQAGVEDAVDDDPIARGLVNGYIMTTIGQSVDEPGYDDKTVESSESPEKFGFNETVETINDIRIDFYFNQLYRNFEITIQPIIQFGKTFVDKDGDVRFFTNRLSTNTKDPVQSEEFFNRACELAREGKSPEEMYEILYNESLYNLRQ
ncbi:MAG: hypothetical protein R6V74_00535 [Lutibacter sp.]